MHEFLDLQAKVHANIKPVLDNINKVQEKWGNAGFYLASLASVIVYGGMVAAELGKRCTSDGKVPRILDNPLFNPQRLFSLILGRGFEKVFSDNLIFRKEALLESMKDRVDDYDIEAQRPNDTNKKDDKSKKLKKLSMKDKGWIFTKNLVEGAFETFFSPGFFLVLAGRLLDNILQDNRDDIKNTTNETNTKFQENGQESVALVEEIRSISETKQAETQELKNKMSNAHSQLKNFNDQTLPDEIRRYNQELLSDSSKSFSPEFQEMMSSPEFTNLIITAYQPDDDFTNTLNAFEKFTNKLSSHNNSTYEDSTNPYPSNFTNVDPYQEIESHYTNVNRTIDEPSLPNKHSFGMGKDVAVISAILMMRVIGGYIMETRDLDKSLDKDMVSTRQTPFEWLTSWFTEQKPYRNAVTDASLYGKYYARKHDNIENPLAFLQNQYDLYKKDDGDSPNNV